MVVLATPVHTHVDLAEAAHAGRRAHVLLEKPPAPTLDGLDRLLAAQREPAGPARSASRRSGSGAVTESCGSAARVRLG